MRSTFNLVAAAATAAAFLASVSLPATAACKRYGFTVNDYGKEGPTKDAKALLDKLIATKMSEQGIKDFRTGKKTVSCDLFLNFIVFDEHTCTAEATVCWGGSVLPKSEDMAAADEVVAKPKKASADGAESADEKKHANKKSEQGTDKKKSASLKVIADPKKPVVAEPPEHAASAPEASEAAPAAASNEAPATEAPATAAAKTASPVETGSLSEAAKPAQHHDNKADGDASGSNDVPPVKLDTGAGYPAPEAPQENQ